jgi:hypothetical protein
MEKARSRFSQPLKELSYFVPHVQIVLAHGLPEPFKPIVPSGVGQNGGEVSQVSNLPIYPVLLHLVIKPDVAHFHTSFAMLSVERSGRPVLPRLSAFGSWG